MYVYRNSFERWTYISIVYLVYFKIHALRNFQNQTNILTKLKKKKIGIYDYKFKLV